MSVYRKISTSSEKRTDHEIESRMVKLFHSDTKARKRWTYFFNLTEKAYKDGNATSLLRYFGGEAIFKPFLADSDLNQILTSLGEPLIVRAAIDASSIKAFNSNAFGITWLSTYHHSLNPNAIKQDYDVYIEKPINPEDIISIQVVPELA